MANQSRCSKWRTSAGEDEMTMPGDTAAAYYRTCERCLVGLPIEEFRLRRAGHRSRHVWCRACHNGAERTRRAAIRAGAPRQEVAKMVGRLRDYDPDRRAAAVCAAMVERCGGVNRLVDIWMACMQRDLEKGGRAGVRHIALIMRLIQCCQDKGPDYSLLTDDELRLAAVSVGIDPDDP